MCSSLLSWAERPDFYFPGSIVKGADVPAQKGRRDGRRQAVRSRWDSQAGRLDRQTYREKHTGGPASRPADSHHSQELDPCVLFLPVDVPRKTVYLTRLTETDDR